MVESWYTTGGSGNIHVCHSGDQWIVSEPTVDSKTICLFTGNEPPTTKEEVAITVEVQSFRMGSGSDTNYLTVELKDSETDQSEPELSEEEAVLETASSENFPERKLTELQGSGELVTVEATIEEIEFVAKNTPNTPDLKAVVREEGSIKRVPLVVSDGVSHPHLDTGGTIRFSGVKDHNYAKKNENQLLVTEHTDFTELE